jgi:hypothetical protein
MKGRDMSQLPPAPLPQWAAQPVQYADPNTPVYFPSDGRGKIVRALLWASMGLTLLGGVWTMYELTLPAGAMYDDAVEVDAVAVTSLLAWAMTMMAVFVMTAIFFCMWMYRAHANLRALGALGTDYTSGWAAGAWFVPFLNLVRPYRIMKEIYRGSDPAHLGASDLAWKLTDTPKSIDWWWAAWIISNFVSRISSRMERQGPDVQYAALYVDLANIPITIIAAWLVINITRKIDQMQRERARALWQAYAGQAPASAVAPAMAT